MIAERKCLRLFLSLCDFDGTYILGHCVYLLPIIVSGQDWYLYHNGAAIRSQLDGR